jgi:MoxR-like ATPase
MNDQLAPAAWHIFKGERHPHDGLKGLPKAPPWRPFGQKAELIPPPPGGNADSEDGGDAALGRKFRCSAEMRDAVNLALYLRRPLLVTGNPGCGKSTLVLAVAHELRLGPVLHWSITSKSTVKDGLYAYDALGRLQELKGAADAAAADGKGDAAKRDPAEHDADIGRFIELGPLGTALLPTDWPRALLIDEIDKSDLDFPNDLLNIFERGEYPIPELARARLKQPERGVAVRKWRSQQTQTISKGHVRCRHFPFVVLTSNGEREFPPAFLRRCIRFTINEPDDKMLGRIVESHFDEATKVKAQALITEFVNNRDKKKQLATDQLLNAVYLVLGSNEHFDEKDKARLIEKLYQPISGAEATS